MCTYSEEKNEWRAAHLFSIKLMEELFTIPVYEMGGSLHILKKIDEGMFIYSQYNWMRDASHCFV